VRSTGQTGALDVQILYKSYLPHPDSNLDVPHMNLDLLDETYPMMKSKLYFVVFNHTGLTGGTHRSDRSDKTCQFWVRTDPTGLLACWSFLNMSFICPFRPEDGGIAAANMSFHFAPFVLRTAASLPPQGACTWSQTPKRYPWTSTMAASEVKVTLRWSSPRWYPRCIHDWPWKLKLLPSTWPTPFLCLCLLQFWSA
jgi:hypothetical protein